MCDAPINCEGIITMLIITRRAGETFFIGDDVQVTVLRSSGGSVRFGITAPKDVNVARAELIERTQEDVEHSEARVRKSA